MSHPSRHLLAVLLLAFPLAALPAQEPADVDPPVPALVPATTLAPAPALTASATEAAPTVAPDVAPQGGPRLAATRVGVDIAPASVTDDALQDNPTTRRGVRHMIVGGAAIIVGGLVGDDAGTVIAVGGAALLIYGVYLYLQGS